MFIERKINPSSHAVELWRCEWENPEGAPAKKVYLGKIGEEQPLVPEAAGPVMEAAAICWSYGRTLGNIAVFSQSLLGRFPEKSGDDALLPCDFVNAGKFRHGAERWWCRRIKPIGAPREIKNLSIALGKCVARTTHSQCITWSRLWPLI